MPSCNSSAPLGEVGNASDPSLLRLEVIVTAVVALVVGVLMLSLRWSWLHDDVTFAMFASPDGPFDGSLRSFLSARLATWTSRFAIEAVLFKLTRSIILWRAGTALAIIACIVLPPWLITSVQRTRIVLIVASAMMFSSIPSMMLFDAGLIATSVNYLWVLAAGLWAATPAVLIIQRRRARIWIVVIAAIMAIYAGSSELMAVFLLLTYLIATAIAVTRRAIRWPMAQIAILITFALTSAVLVGYHLTNQGNRTRAGVVSWIITDFERAFFSTLRQAFISGYLIPLAFLALCVVGAYIRQRGRWVYAVATVPLWGSLILRDQAIPGTLGMVMSNSFSAGSLLWAESPVGWVQTFGAANLMSAAILTAMLILTIVSVIYASTAPARHCIILILAVGFMSKFTVVPTVGEALRIQFHRTDTYLIFAFLIATLILLADILDTNGFPQWSHIHANQSV